MIIDENGTKAAAIAAARLAVDSESLRPPEYFPSPSPSHASISSLHSPSLGASSSGTNSPNLTQPPPRVVLARGDGEDETLLTAELSQMADVPPEVVLSWAGASVADLPELVRQSQMLETGLPPDYASSQTITSKTVFTFSPSSSNTMLLLPPPTAQDSRPLLNVHISVNCFNPGSSITTARKGASPDSGEYIGEFEMGVSTAMATVTIGQSQKPIDPGVLTGWRKGKRTTGTYDWRFHEQARYNLRWLASGITLTCTILSSKEILAVFRVTPLAPRTDGRRHPPPTLELWPKVYNDSTLLAQVVMSALVLERKRLMPSTDSVN